MAPAEMDLTSKYEVRHQIGKGSFGSAFLVTNKQDKQDYVLKRVRLAKQTKWQRNSTLQERDLVMALQHPFVVPCVESWMVQDHTVNMIYGYCEKGDLSTHLAKVQRMRGQVEEMLMTKWLCQLLLALDYLQTMKVLHRDIKTSNVLLTCDMDAQLGDFGLATLMQEAGGGSKPEDTNLVGTPHYMSPELLSCKDYGFKTDVWSLGCVFYELTAQRPTFNAFNIHGLVSKIKKNKLAPLPDGYSAEWREVVGLMLCKNPDRRPSVQELMGLPQLRPALLEARARAKMLMPSVKLPPLLDPTPLVVRPRLSGDTAIATDSDNSGHASSPDRELDAVPAGIGEVCSSKWGAGAAAAQALQESEFQEIFRVNSMQGKEQRQQPEQQQQQDDDVGDDDEQVEADSDCHMTDRSRCSISSRGSSSLAGSLKTRSPTGGMSALEAIKHLHQRVRQPGISKMTPAQRVAAAIAAARATKKPPVAAELDGEAAAMQPDRAGAAEPPRQHSSSSSSSTSTAMRSLARRSCPVSAASRPPPLPPAAATDGGATSSRPPSSASRPHSGRSSAAASPRPAWNAGPAAAAGGAGALHRQRSAGGRSAGTTPTLKAAAVAAAGKAGLRRSSAGSNPGGHSYYLQQLEEQRQERKHQPGAVAAAERHGPGSVQSLLDKSQELTRRTVQLQQQHARPPRVQRPAFSEGGQVRLPLQNVLAQQQQQEEQQEQLQTPVRPGQADDDDGSDDEDSSSAGDSAIKQLQFDSASPGSGLIQHTEVCTLDATSAAAAASTPQPVATGPTPEFGTPEASTPDMFAAAQGTSTNSNGTVDKSPMLWGNAATASTEPEQQQLDMEQQHCTLAAAAATASQTPSSEELLHRSSDGCSNSRDTAAHAAADDSRRLAPGVSDSAGQRVQLLESVVQLMGGLYARGRWQEMGNVLCSSGLLSSPMQSAVQTAMVQSPFDATGADTSSNSSRSVASSVPGQQDIIKAGMSRSQRELKLGDCVVLGRSRKVKGRIRYIGPVAWDAAGDEWVGMELDAACGTNGTQQGVMYFTCPPGYAAFHRAIELMSA